MKRIYLFMKLLLLSLTKRSYGFLQHCGYQRRAFLIHSQACPTIICKNKWFETTAAATLTRRDFSINVKNGHNNDDIINAEDANNEDENIQTFYGNVTILDRGKHHIVVAKPPSVLCHHSNWAGSRSHQKKKNHMINPNEPEIPMLQRVRQAMKGNHVNLIHRLDRGCSGCLLFAMASSGPQATTSFQEALANKDAIKTYIAIVRGEGILYEHDFKKDGWFTVSRPIKNENGNLHNATTNFRFIAGQDNISNPNRPRASLVLARPQTGKWHQIRRHLNG